MSRMADLAYQVETDPEAAAEELGMVTPEGKPDDWIWRAIRMSAISYGVPETALLEAFGRGQQKARTRQS